jgi:hypothetical protein
MQKLLTVCLLFAVSSYSSIAQKGRKLVWSDEFNYTGLPDSTKWDYDTGGQGWGNNELQFYTARRLLKPVKKIGTVIKANTLLQDW